MSKIKTIDKTSRADKYIASIGAWVIDWMQDYIEAFPSSSDSDFFIGAISHLERKGYLSSKQLKIIGRVWNDSKDGWPEYQDRASESNPF